MSEHTVTIRELPARIGDEVRLRGWVRRLRSSGKISFLVLRDGTDEIQCVFVRNEVPPEVWEPLTTVGHEACVAVTGVVRSDARAPSGVELTGSDFEVLGPSTDFPIQPKEHGVDFLLENRHL
ncbi:MAG: asparagine--tRNA ligase, partial [Gemmatimonadales bacterium]|nr:asparagine--tRNA ligase [Gemmatimonadales bacterium]